METSYNKGIDGTITVTVKFKPEGTMLSQEEQIEQALSSLGLQLSQSSLETFDTDGRALIVTNKKYTSKGQEKKRYKPLMEKLK
jgi:hypothetical protein